MQFGHEDSPITISGMRDHSPQFGSQLTCEGHVSRIVLSIQFSLDRHGRCHQSSEHNICHFWIQITDEPGQTMRRFNRHTVRATAELPRHRFDTHVFVVTTWISISRARFLFETKLQTSLGNSRLAVKLTECLIILYL